MKNSLKTFLFFSSILLVNCSSSEVPAEETPMDSTEKITYEKDVKSIINSSCATSACHDSAAPAASLSLTNYTQVRSAAENRNLIGRINSASNPMPAAGRISSEKRAIIDKWKADGYLEN